MHNAIKRSKTHVFICMLLFCSCFVASAQTSKIDDLLSQLKPTDPDTTKIKVLRKLSAAYTSVDPIKKYYYANEYLHLAQKNNIDSTIANAYLDIGISHAVRSNLDSGLYYFRLGHEKAKAINYLNGMARGYVNMGFILDRQDKKRESVKNYEESLKIYRQLNHKRGINQCIMNLGSIYFDLKEYKTADLYFKQVLENVRETPNDQVGLANALFSLGNSNRKIGDPRVALDYFKQSLAIREKLGDVNGIALSNWGIGLVLNNSGKYTDALKHFEVALKNNRQTKNVYQEAIVLMSISETYLNLKDYKKAEQYAKTAMVKSKESDSKGLVAQSLEYLIKVETAQKKFADALEHQSDYLAITDSLKETETKREVILDDLARVNTDNKKLEKHNEKISAKIIDYSYAIAIISVLLFILIILLVLYYKKNAGYKTANELLKQQKFQTAEINEELSALNEELKTQMEIVSAQNIELEKLNKIKNKFFSIVSHDLRSPIHSLKALFGMYRSGILSEEELSDILQRLEETVYTTASFLDNLLEWSKSQLEGIVINPSEVDLNDVIDHNIKLMDSQIRAKNLSVQNNTSNDDKVFADLNMVHVVVRNLLSNAVKFCDANCQITFSSQKLNGQIRCAISDTGRGISESDLENLFNLTHHSQTGTSGEKGHHIGLILCRDMILQNKGTLEVESKLGEGTTFYITLPTEAE
ncbi:tetratricopeptide repeat-containing sensor histidine kinase [Pedobacter sp.]